MSDNPTPKRTIDGPNYAEKKPCANHNGPSSVTLKFSMKVVNYILQQNLKTNPKNVVCSLSMDSVLNIIAVGSKGDTLKQLLELNECQDVEELSAAVYILGDVLKESKGGDDDEGPEIAFANALWVDQRYTLKKAFQQIVRDIYKIEAASVDFLNQPGKVVKEANLWAEKQSKGLIKEILSETSLEKDTIMLLTNALYFKGNWVHKFQQKYTEVQDFYLLNGKKVRVPFMNRISTRFYYGTYEGCQVLRMLYRQEKISKGEKPRNFSMYIILPEKFDGLADLLGKIQVDSTMFMDKIKLDSKIIDNLIIPKFKFECELQLKKSMEELGLTLPFDANSKDITEIVEFPWLYINDMIQKSHVEVDEEGTKAVALTSISLIGGGGIPPPRINFVADHPFLFLIREDYSGAILFMGTVLNP